MLTVDSIETSYGVSQVLFGVSLAVEAGQVVTLLGRNGMGKTTTVRSIMGIARPRAGTIRFEGRAIHGLPPYRVAQAGLGLVPEGRQVFPNLTVRENLVATAANRAGSADPWRVEPVFELFPQLAARARSLGGALSGGEQQMLAIGRALMSNPRVLRGARAARPRRDLALRGAAQGRRPVAPAHRQGRGSAHPHRGCALHPREGSDRLERNVRRPESPSGHPAPVPRRMRDCTA